MAPTALRSMQQNRNLLYVGYHDVIVFLSLKQNIPKHISPVFYGLSCNGFYVVTNVGTGDSSPLTLMICLSVTSTANSGAHVY